MIKKKRMLFLIIIIILISVFVVTNILFYKKVNRTFNSLNDIIIPYGKKVNLKQNLNMYFIKNIDLNDYITIDWQEKKDVGTYDIKYKINIYFYKKELTKKLIIKDTEAPIIKLVGGDVTIYDDEEYLEPGFEAFDNYDGDISNKVIITDNFDYENDGDFEVFYNVSDSSSNKALEVSRKVKVVKRNIDNTQENVTTSNNNITKNITFSKTSSSDDKVINYINDLENYLNKYKVSIGYYNLSNNFTYLYKENKIYFGASLIKTVDAMYAYEKNILDEKVKEQVKLAIIKSSNSAHKYLIDLIGHDNLKAYGNNLGAINTLGCKDNFCNTTVIDQLYYLNNLYKLIDSNEELKSYFINDYGNYLSYDYSYTNLHKYGNSGEYFHDVGIFLGDKPYIIVVLTKEKGNGEPYVADLIRNISKKINELNNLVY